MASKHTTLCVVNFSELNIDKTVVSEVDNYDWDGDSRPDKNFKDASIQNHSSRCEREEINTNSRGCWYRMTFTFSGGSTLTFRNDQKDAETKHNRTYDASGSAVGPMELYQASGGDTNGMYIRSLPEPDNTGWMAALLARKPGVTLNNLAMPGSHDAGMYITTNCSITVKSEWARTQGGDIARQLKAGSRYFDFRVYWDGNDYRIGHFGSMGGCYGPPLSEVLDQVKTFIQGGGSKEAIILKFSHTMGDSPLQPFLPGPVPIPNPSYRSPAQVAKATVDMVKNKLGTSVYTSRNADADLSQTLLSEVSGKVVTTFGSEFKDYWSAASGVFPYRDIPDTGYGLRVYDNYSNTDSLPNMVDDQLKKLQSYGGWGKGYLFLLSWTLTGAAGLLDIQVLAGMANPWLPQTLSDIKAGKLNHPNIVFLDYIDPYICRNIIDLNY